MLRFWAVVLLFFPHCQSYRITDGSVVEVGAEEKACDVNTCVTFDEDATKGCSCMPFLADPTLVQRAERTFYEIVQASRYLTDHQAESAGFIRSLYPVRKFRQMKHASLMSASMKEFEFLQNAMDVLEGVEDLADESASNLTGTFKAPAGAFPIMVEVWDSDVTRSQFIGEVGVGLSLGERSHTLPLSPNKNCGTKSLKMAEKESIGTVTFTTKVEMGPKENCNPGKAEECAEVTVTVSCEKAAGLPSMDQFSKSDPYCKVRIKSSDTGPSTSFKTKAIDNTADPDWTSLEHSFSTSFPVLVDDGKPWSIDSMSLTGQFMANMRLMAKMLALGGKECPDIESPSTRQKQVCDLLWAPTSSIDDATVHEAAASLSDEDAQVLTKMATDAKADGVDETGDSNSFAEMAGGHSHSEFALAASRLSIILFDCYSSLQAILGVACSVAQHQGG